MKKLNLLICAALALCGATVNAASGIKDSAHDWAQESWNVNKDLCGPCHMAHGSDPNNQLIPLWSHETTSASGWQPYVSPHSTPIGQPSGQSLACLSCHDGTLAYNQLKGQQVGPDKLTVQGDYIIGNGASHDLRGDHPVSFSYQAAVNASPTNTLKLATEVLGSTLPALNTLNGQTVSQAFLKSGQVECSSCHDVHRSVGDAGVNSDKSTMTSPSHNPLLKAYGVASDNYGSSLCRSCHNK
jgi:hypothetical protein